jgi:very-short-patch-repair endonuclease
MPIDANKDNAKKQARYKKAADTMFAGAENTLFKRAVELRKQPTQAEEVLWGYLRTKPHGFKFRRQHPYLNYILDFYCHALHLVIEVDGSIHNNEDVRKNDEIRQTHLRAHQLTVLRFTNDEVERKQEEAILQIEQHLPKPGKTE